MWAKPKGTNTSIELVQGRGGAIQSIGTVSLTLLRIAYMRRAAGPFNRPDAGVPCAP